MELTGQARYHRNDALIKLGQPPWPGGPTLEAWIKAHGHDPRLECYTEFGCLLIERDLEALEDAVIRVRERIAFYRAVLDPAGLLAIAPIAVREILDQIETALRVEVE